MGHPTEHVIDPYVGFTIIVIAAVAWLYCRGVSRIRRGTVGTDFVGPARILSLLCGLLILVATLAFPLSKLDARSIAVHMVNHLLVMLLAAPLIVWGRPIEAIVAAISKQHNRLHGSDNAGQSHSSWLSNPGLAWCLFCGVIIFWHLPTPYHWAQGSSALHIVMSISFLFGALMFWSVVLEPSGQRRLDYGRTMIFVFSAALVTALPGALLTFARRPILATTADAPAILGLNSLQDQQLAGLIMWIPMDLVLFGVCAFLFAAWLNAADRPRPGVIS